MKKGILIYILIFLTIFITGCGKENEEKQVSFVELKVEVGEELELAKNGKYENLTIVCDEIQLPKTEQLKEMKFPVYNFTKGMSLSDKLEFYRDIVFPKVMDMDSVEEKHIVDMYSYDVNTGKYGYDYEYMMKHANEMADSVLVGYGANEDYKSVETVPEGVCFNLSLGTIGKLMKDDSAFVAMGFEEVKSYNCDMDDLSDAYLIMDGTQKTVSEAKIEIENYLNAHYPIIGDDNGIRNEVYEITVRKIPDTEYHVFDARRTFSYEGIRTKERTNTKLENEVGVMGQAFLCESGKVDLLLGFVNCFDKGTVSKVYEEFLPFEEVMSRLSYYMTNETVFDVEHITMEYRMFTETVDNKTYYNWIPYWSFLVENPNDNSVIRVYINIENGEIDSYQI